MVDYFLWVLLPIYGIIAYLIQAICLQKMARKAGRSKIAWCAWVPILIYYLIGELSGFENGGFIGAMSASSIVIFNIIKGSRKL